MWKRMCESGAAQKHLLNYINKKKHLMGGSSIERGGNQLEILKNGLHGLCESHICTSYITITAV